MDMTRDESANDQTIAFHSQAGTMSSAPEPLSGGISDRGVSVRHIAVIGSGQMGTQFAEYLLQMGYHVIIKTRSVEKVPAICSKVRKRLSKRLSEEMVQRSMDRLKVTTEFSALKDAMLVIEASREDLAIKRDIFHSLSQACTPSTVFATNSSSLSTDLLAEATDRPDRFIGMHFFNPIHRMDLVEIIMGRRTSEATKAFAISLVKELMKCPIVVRNSPGFIVNRLLMPQINEAIQILSEGIASREDIDSAIKLGLNHPMGPLELADLIGLDTCLSIMREIDSGLQGRHLEPAPLLQEMVDQGKLGFKSGEGFYTYRRQHDI